MTTLTMHLTPEGAEFLMPFPLIKNATHNLVFDVRPFDQAVFPAKEFIDPDFIAVPFTKLGRRLMFQLRGYPYAKYRLRVSALEVDVHDAADTGTHLRNICFAVIKAHFPVWFTEVRIWSGFSDVTHVLSDDPNLKYDQLTEHLNAFREAHPPRPSDDDPI